MQKWKTNSSRYIVDDKWLKLRADSCTTPDGDILDPWYVIEYPGWVNCLVIDKNDQVVMLKHYRHGIDDFVPEIVGGNMDKEDTDPLDTMKRELAEEIGYENGSIYKTGENYANPSNQNNNLYSFLAVGGECSGDLFNEIGADFTIERIPFTDFVNRIVKNDSKIKYQSLQLASIFLSFNFMKNNHDASAELTRLNKLLSQC